MLKNGEFAEAVWLRRYKWIMEIPALIIGFTLSLFEFNYIFIMTLVTGLIVIKLIIFGLMDIQYNYALKEFITDMVYLFSVNFFVTVMATPSFLYTLNSATEATYTFTNVIRLTVSFVLLYLAWYMYIILTVKVKKNLYLRWKWDVTRIIASDKKRLSVK